MIKPFKMTDLGYFLPNQFSDPDCCLAQLADSSFVTMSLWDKGMVAAVICFKNYWGNNWVGFFLIAQEFPPKLALVLRSFIRSTMIKVNAHRLQTDSVACKELDTWHEFMGFKYEGTREKMMFDRDYNMWALMRGGN